jgi:hypothetical protein
LLKVLTVTWFKIVLGKTNLAYALEDFHEQATVAEIINEKADDNNDNENPADTQIISKFVEVHDFFSKVDTEKMNKILKKALINGSFTGNQNKEIHKSDLVTTMPISIFDINGSSDQFGHLYQFFMDRRALIMICIDITTFDESMGSNIYKSEERLKYWLDMILFKMSKTCSFYILPVVTKCDLYMSNHKRKSSKSPVKEANSKRVNNKSPLWFEIGDTFTKTAQTKINSISSIILSKIRDHFVSRLEFVKSEIAKIVALSIIPHSLYARLLKLKEVQDALENFKGIHDHVAVISSLTMHGMHQLNQTVNSIICDNELYFPSVNKKIPTLWIEVEKYVQSRLNRIPATRFTDETSRQSNANAISSIFGLCIDYEEYKERITDKYGMKHMIAEITKYLNSQGKVLWFDDSENLSSKVFLKPNMLFDFLHSLYRKDFDENFYDTHLQVIRSKLSLSNNITQDRIERLKQDLLLKGCAYIDLLKLIWLPIMISDSVDLLYELVTLLMAFFNIGYPQVPKSKMKTVFHYYSNLLEPSNNKSSNKNGSSSHLLKRSVSRSTKINSSRSQSKISSYEEQQIGRSSNIATARADFTSDVPEYSFDCIMIPFYMPCIKNEEKLTEISNTLTELATNVAKTVFEANGGKLILPRISLKYVFPWGTTAGLFERFTVNCIINTEVYYKMHWKDAVYAYNEENTIG